MNVSPIIEEINKSSVRAEVDRKGGGRSQFVVMDTIIQEIPDVHCIHVDISRVTLANC